jgi:hypothetical protein
MYGRRFIILKKPTKKKGDSALSMQASKVQTFTSPITEEGWEGSVYGRRSDDQ